MAIQYSPISQEQYRAARMASGAFRNYSTRVDVGSTLRDRTPAPQEKPLDEGQFVWGGPSNFTWGSRNGPTEQGPRVNTSFSVNWPDYGLGDPNQPDDDEGENGSLPAAVYQWEEVARSERTVRVEGPDGSYVDVNRLDTVVFQLPNSNEDGRSRLQFVVMNFAKV